MAVLMRNTENDVETFFKQLGRFRISKFGIVQNILKNIYFRFYVKHSVLYRIIKEMIP
jgi:hypothetical protein